MARVDTMRRRKPRRGRSVRGTINDASRMRTDSHEDEGLEDQKGTKPTILGNGRVRPRVLAPRTRASAIHGNKVKKARRRRRVVGAS